MLHIRNNGKVLEVRRVGPVKVRFRAREGGPPIKARTGLYEEDEGSRLLRGLADSGHYDRENLRSD